MHELQLQFFVSPEGTVRPDVWARIGAWVRESAGKSVELSLRIAKTKRTSAQNRRYFALLTVGARSLWEDESDAERLHEEMAHLLLALPACPKTGMRRRQRTPKLNTDEFGQYMDRVADKLIEFGADLSGWGAEIERQSRAA